MQYLEPIIAATWSEEGAVGDVCKALAPRFREPNAIVRVYFARTEADSSRLAGRVQGPHRPPYHDAQRRDG